MKSVFAGRYEILLKLGGGGMGRVYKVLDKKLHRYVALKFLTPKLSGNKEAKVRFIQEAQAASVLDHQNVCTVYEIDETPEGQMYIAMAYYEGETLKKKIERGPQDFAGALDAVIQILRGLSKTHEQGIVHRDIKPANVIETGDHVIKIVDFGLAKLAREATPTKTVTVIGTPAYMSPEQALGEDTDQRTDLWSSGVVFFELLTGRLPFSGDGKHSILSAIVHRPPVPVRDLRADIPEDAERIILKCLEKRPENRYASADELLADLLKLRAAWEKGKADVARRKRAQKPREAERRLATVLAGEILGSSEILKGLDPEEAALVMDRCFDLSSSIVNKYGSRVTRVAGNSFMAAFGVPLAIEDSPKKAVNAAIELRNSLTSFNRDEGLSTPLEIRLGINTGTVIMGARDSDQEVSVLGENADLASQFCGLSEKNGVIVGPLTYRSTSGDFEYEAMRPIPPRGKAEPVSVFRLLSSREKPYRARPGGGRMIDSEMVGRDGSLDKLLLHVLKVINGEGSIVSVIGEAGIGKSRLVAELSQKEEIKKATVLQGRALSYGSNLSFHPVIDMLRRWAGIEEDDSPSMSARKLEKAIQSTFPEGAAEAYPFIATMMGLKLSGAPEERIKGVAGDSLEKLILKNFRDLIIKVSALKPLILIFEDLHWADTTSLDLLESLFRLAAGNRILFINVFRRDYEASERILRTLRSRYPDRSVEIVLEPLSEAECATLIGNLLKEEAIPVNIRDLIARRAEGNPFFIEEVARSFIDDGIVEIREGRFRVTDRIDAVEIPESISDIIMARVDKLDEQTKSLLKTASVIGRNFFYRILADVAASIGEIDHKLEDLKEAQLILEQVRMEEIEYLFKHALAQEAVYNSILSAKRKALHLEVARSIERVFGDKIHEFYGLLAYHFSLGEGLDQAEDYLIKAGEEALKSSASNEALHYYREALRIYLEKHGKSADKTKVAMLEKNIAVALFNKGRFNEADDHFDAALSRLGEEMPKKPLAMAAKFLPGLARFLFRLYIPSAAKIRSPGPKTREIIGIYEKKSRLLATIDPKRMFIESFYFLPRLIGADLSRVENGVGLFAMSSGLFSYSGISMKISRKIIERAEQSIDPEDTRALLYYRLAKLMHHLVAGEWEKIEAYDPDLLDQGLKFGELWATTTYCLFYGWVKACTGKYAENQLIDDKVSEISNTFEDDFSKSTRFIIRTELFWEFGKIEQAVTEVDAAIKFFSDMNYRAYLSEQYAYKARLHLLSHEPEKADECFRISQEIAREGHPAPMTSLVCQLGLCSRELNQLEELRKNRDTESFGRTRRTASKIVRKTVRLTKKVIYKSVEAYRLEGRLRWIKGNRKKAFKSWQRSIDVGQSLGLLPELARTFSEIGRRLIESDGRRASWNGVHAEEYLHKAEEIFTRLNMEWDLGALKEEENP